MPGARFDRLSELSGTTASHSSKLKRQRRSETGFKIPAHNTAQQLVICCIEVHAASRNDLLPDPRYDAVHCVVLSAVEDDDAANPYHKILIFHPSTAQLETRSKEFLLGMKETEIKFYETEWALLAGFVHEILLLDPDILTEFEMQKSSLGYLAERALILGIHLLNEIARMPIISMSSAPMAPDSYGERHSIGLRCSGRILLNAWRILRHEIKLNIYTFENCVAEVLKIRLPKIPQSTLHAWFLTQSSDLQRCLHYYWRRAVTVLEMLDHLDVVGRTAEMARIYGVDFFSVLSRGSQYRVESMLVRLAHSQNYIMISPSKQQVFEQPAMESIPLVLEPKSDIICDPVVVLDFQSLYPSLVIAYNLCFSTLCAKNVDIPGSAVQLGVTDYITPEMVWDGGVKSEDFIVTPNGMVFLPPEKKRGILPRLLKEILDTRILVKKQMKLLDPNQKTLLRCLNSRQFGLKMIANVSYGYTAAGFSGRMPMAELADAIVQSGRQTLINTIEMIQSNPEWNAYVAYGMSNFGSLLCELVMLLGDTDSVFVQLPGRNRQQAFQIGKEIAEAVTRVNPAPMELKLEKVYHPCVLLTKKHYVGYMYESPEQQNPRIDAKGIETIRRDACPAVSKIMQKVLSLLFSTKDLSQIKSYLQRQWSKILADQVSIQDFIFAKEVRLGSYHSQILPPAAVVATQAMKRDPRREPQYAERVPYVVVYGQPGSRLVDLIVDPYCLIYSEGELRLNALYYITKQINPALDRILALIGISVQSWFNALPRSLRSAAHKRKNRAAMRSKKQRTIDSYYLSRHCPICDELTYASQLVCPECQNDPQKALSIATTRSMRLQSQLSQLQSVCRRCGGYPVPPNPDFCHSLDCPIFFERVKLANETQNALSLSQHLAQDWF